MHFELVLIKEVPVTELAIRVQEHQVAIIVEIPIMKMPLQLAVRKKFLFWNDWGFVFNANIAKKPKVLFFEVSAKVLVVIECFLVIWTFGEVAFKGAEFV